MREQQRQHYLQALGIESYAPRWLLPGAAESPLLPPELEPIVAESSPEYKAPEAPTDLARDSAVSAAPAAVEAPSKVASPLLAEPARRKRPAAAAAPQPLVEHRFTLSAQRLSEGLLALDSRRPQLALPVDRLLANLARALGIPSAPRTSELLRWPMAGTVPASEADSIAEARAMVRTYLAAQAEKQSFRWVLLMGFDAARHALPAREEGGEWERQALAKKVGQSLPLALETPGSDAQGIILPSLTAILHKPALKVLVWKALKELPL